MATLHKGSPPNDESSAPESGTVREESDNKGAQPQQQHQPPPKRQPGKMQGDQNKRPKKQ
jgi:hypothetical protein